MLITDSTHVEKKPPLGTLRVKLSPEAAEKYDKIVEKHNQNPPTPVKDASQVPDGTPLEKLDKAIEEPIKSSIPNYY